MPRPGSKPGNARPVSARQSAAVHAQTRRAHAKETAEDYAEAIADLISSRGEARVTDIAQLLGVSHVTVVRTIARLQRDGWVTAKPYRSIFLTDSGARLAEMARRRHGIVLSFLLSLGVSEAAALADAEGIEHHVSDETLAAFERFSRRTKKGPA
ncbi:MAG: manganese-binding transcriptional regulator MntR [Phycisphaeraceae bacterium]|nr:manganese-binding transcriptional regulator MntR [Phycisphaeraceae bacterium]